MEELPPGFRFYPTEEELVGFYLKNKLEGTRQDLNRLIDRVIPVVDIYDHDPTDLPQIWERLSQLTDPEQWIFFVARRESERRGGRPSRQTAAGYWKATGSAGYVYSNDGPIGGKRTMVFYRGRAPNGTKTEWRMNEYTALEPHHHHASSSSSSPPSAAASSSINVVPPPVSRQEYSVCRVYKKSSRLRSFDRRPPQAPPPAPPQQPLAPSTVMISQFHDNNQSSTQSQPPNQNPRDHMTENAHHEQEHHHDHSLSSSPSSSGDHGNTNITVDDTSSYWEQLDSFLGYI